ncbi:MAG: aspartate 1-decarboxylase [Verrucomicrobiales bacterium]
MKGLTQAVSVPEGKRRRSRELSGFPLDRSVWRWFVPCPVMLRQVLKSKLYKAVASDSIVDYEGSIEIPRDLMEAADLWAGEKVLVASNETAARMETYLLPGEPGTGRILINGGAANRIKKGERLTIMAFALTDAPVDPVKLVLDADNRIVRSGK